jgi:mono/diheme cytochrome c family protein
MTLRKNAITLALTAFLWACGGGEPEQQSETQVSQGSADATPAELTATQLEQGIGPIHDLELGPVDDALAAAGADAFLIKCSACHKIEERYVAPELGTVLSRRRPEFVMNMILNADEMVLRHPVVQELLVEYFTPMPVQVTDQAEARSILEYLRSAQIQNP